MPTNKRLTDLTDYTSVMPYASELFGVYQPMLGWKSKRIARRLNEGLTDVKGSLLQAYAKHFTGDARPVFDQCTATIALHVGKPQPVKLLQNNDSILMQALISGLPKNEPVKKWKEFINEDRLEKILAEDVASFYATAFNEQCTKLSTTSRLKHLPGTAKEALLFQKRDLESNTTRLLDQESALAGALLALVEHGMTSQLETIFYEKATQDLATVSKQIAELFAADDPFATFDPKRDIKNVSLSPLGIVHLFRQYFFELDTFLGTPTGHVWLSPGSTVELIEVSTRRVLVEKTIEQSTEFMQRRETSSTDKDEFSEAVKQDNKNDLKLGASLTVNQSWGTGNATATGSLNMENTQTTARETTHKRMREQSQKLVSEIKQNFKSTFKTVTETTDTSSKRYVLTNSGANLVNYELRRKMRQVGVQLQDIGTYLCWETFVDEPGKQLGLSDLVHIAKPADLVDVPPPNDISMPADKKVPFSGPVQWNPVKFNQVANADHFLPIGTIPMPPVPEGYEVRDVGSLVDVVQLSGSGEGFGGTWIFRGRINETGIEVGPFIPPSGTSWDEIINFVVGGVVYFTPDDTTRKSIDDAKKKQVVDATKASNDNLRKTKEAFLTAAKERIEFASNINTRKYEDLREEERIIVYRRLIGTLMYDTLYNTPEGTNDKTRHILSALINSIFDIDKMLYFVAPEWWKPRHHYHQTLGSGTAHDIFSGNLTSWSDLEIRPDNYLITDKSQYARMGSSLGWLLQLDGDDMRNAFLNAPWVKAVIPVRPGKELEASNWLQQMHVEGTDGLDDLYHAPEAELAEIKAALAVEDVTIADALKFLCARVAAKHEDSLKVGRYPTEELDDDNRVSATPVDKVYEHGFYPLPGGFKAVTSGGYEVFDQWIEVLPTDQVVPVEVSYDPKTGRQL